MNTVPWISPQLLLSKNIAIVGSSGNLLSSGFGKKIDAFDEVIRFNRAPIDGYQNDVGSKTTLRVVNNHVFNNNDISKEGYTNQPKNFVKDLRNSRILYFASDLAPWYQRSEKTDASNDLFLFNYQYAEVMRSTFNYPDLKYPTLGAGFMFLCLFMGVVPELFGFDTENCQRSHYWEDRPKESSYHGVSHEKQLFLDLHKAGKIKIHT